MISRRYASSRWCVARSGTRRWRNCRYSGRCKGSRHIDCLSRIFFFFVPVSYFIIVHNVYTLFIQSAEHSEGGGAHGRKIVGSELSMPDVVAPQASISLSWARTKIRSLLVNPNSEKLIITSSICFRSAAFSIVVDHV